MSRYEVLHYPGYCEEAFSAGQLLGCDEIGRPYAVLDAEYEDAADRTTVYLAYATPEQITEATR